MTDTILLAAILIPCLIVAIVFHEVAHGWTALAGLPVFGWAKPVPVIKQRLDNPRFGMMAVAAAGPGMNFALAFVAAVLLGLFGHLAGPPVDGEPSILLTAFTYFIGINVFLALFNLLPIPPFDGSHIVEGVLPRGAARAYEKLRPLGMVMLFALLLVVPYVFPEANIIERVVLPPVEWVMGKYFTVADALAGG